MEASFGLHCCPSASLTNAYHNEPWGTQRCGWSGSTGSGVVKDAVTVIRVLRSIVCPLTLDVSASFVVTAELTIRKHLA